jgi:hypothetical protein
LALTAGAEARKLAEFTVGPVPVAVRNWPVEMTLDLKQLGTEVADTNLDLVERRGDTVVPVSLQIGCDAAPWRAVSQRKTLIWQLDGETPAGATRRFELRSRTHALQTTTVVADMAFVQGKTQTTVSNSFFTITHDATKGFGIARIRYAHTGRDVETLMADEMYLPEENGRKECARMGNPDPHLETRVVERGPLRCVLEARVHFTGLTNTAPQAVYRYVYWKDCPLVGLAIWFPKQSLGVPRFDSVSVARFYFMHKNVFATAAAGEPFVERTFGAQPSDIPLCSRNVSRAWGCLLADGNAFGLIGSNLGSIYGTELGQTIAGPGRAPWWRGPWYGQEDRWQGHLYIGPSDGKGSAVREHAELIAALQPKLSFPGFAERIEKLPASPLVGLAEESMRVGGIGRAIAMLKEAEKRANARSPLLRRFGDGLALANRRVGLYFWKSDAGYSLCGISRAESAHSFLRPRLESTGLWEATLRAPDRMTEYSLSPTDLEFAGVTTRSSDSTATVRFDWRGRDAEVRVTVSLDADSPLSRWRIRVNPRHPDRGLWQVTFPIVPGVGDPARARDESLALATKQGILLPSPSRGVQFGGEKYPGQYLMQFMTYSIAGSSLYLAAYDPKAATKDFYAESDSPGTFAMGIRHEPPYLAVPGRSFATDYDCVLGAFAGDWYDASKVYREWGTKQVWCSKGTVTGRKDVPGWFKRNCLTLRPGARPDKGVDVLVQARQALPDTPMMAIWYDYAASTNLFDSSPDMIPAAPEFVPAVKKGVELNIPSLGFTHAFLWSEGHPEYRSVAVPNALVLANGRPNFEDWGGRMTVTMNPWSPTWQRKYSEVLVGIAKELGVKGSYMDLAGCGPYQDFSSTNGRQPSGGDFWSGGTRAMLKHVRARVRRVEPEFVMLIENPAEPYLDLMDGATMFHGVNPDLTPLNVPMLQTVYGDYLIQYGPKSGGIANPPLEALLPMQTFIYGSQIGRVFAWEPGTTTELLTKLARYRQACLKYFVGAEVLREPKIEYLSDSGTELQKLDRAILRTTRRASDGSVALMFANTTLGAKMRFRFEVDPREYGFTKNEPLSLARLVPDAAALGFTRGVVKRTEELLPMGALVLVIREDRT